jgi:hypothetical protein
MTGIVEMVMAMEYQTQVIGVLITLTQDAIRKEEILVQPQHNSSRLLLIELETRQDKEIVETINNNIVPYFRKDISTLFVLTAIALCLWRLVH